MTQIILLTGATGFVGTQILSALLAQGCTVRLVVRTGKEKNFSHLSQVESIQTTDNLFTENIDWWLVALQNVDTVIHAAWYTEPGHYLHSPKNAACQTGTLLSAQAAVQAGVRRFVGIGTCFEYDLETDRPLSVTAPLNPLTPYASAKVAAYQGLLELSRQHQVSFAWCRLFYLYGDNEDARRLVPYLRARLSAGQVAELSSATQVRDFLDVREAARLIVAAAMSEMQGAVNICSGKATTVRQLAEHIANGYGRGDLLQFGARADNPFDPPYVVGVKSQIPC